MDKTLEIVMVAVALVVAVVIVTGILQSQGSNFGSFAENQTSGSSCSVEANQLSTYCPDSGGGTCSDWSSAAARQACSPSCGLGPNDVC